MHCIFVRILNQIKKCILINVFLHPFCPICLHKFNCTSIILHFWCFFSLFAADNAVNNNSYYCYHICFIIVIIVVQIIMTGETDATWRAYWCSKGDLSFLRSAVNRSRDKQRLILSDRQRWAASALQFCSFSTTSSTWRQKASRPLHKGFYWNTGRHLFSLSERNSQNLCRMRGYFAHFIFSSPLSHCCPSWLWPKNTPGRAFQNSPTVLLVILR